MDIEPKNEENVELNKLKEIHDYYLCTLQILNTKQFYFEEFVAIQDLYKFHQACRADVLAKINELAPKKEEKVEAE